MQNLLVLGIAVGTASTTLTQSKIFRWLHGDERHAGLAERAHPWLGDLFNCAYCMGHWLAALTTALVWQHQDVFWFWAVVYWLAVTGIAALTSGLIGLLFSKQEDA